MAKPEELMEYLKDGSDISLACIYKAKMTGSAAPVVALLKLVDLINEPLNKGKCNVCACDEPDFRLVPSPKLFCNKCNLPKTAQR